jgi:hypothetical protein
VSDLADDGRLVGLPLDQNDQKPVIMRSRNIIFIAVVLLLCLAGYIRFTYIVLNLGGTVNYQYKWLAKKDSFDKKNYLPDSGATVMLLKKGSSVPLQVTVTDKNGRYRWRRQLMAIQRFEFYLWVIQRHRKMDASTTFRNIMYNNFFVTDVLGMDYTKEFEKAFKHIEALDLRIDSLKKVGCNYDSLEAAHEQASRDFLDSFPANVKRNLQLDGDYTKSYYLQKVFDFNLYGRNRENVYN